MTSFIAALACSAFIIIVAELLANFITTRFYAAAILAAIAFIYVGFSLKGNPPALVLLECTMALAFFFVALAGFTRNYLLIAGGIMLHGVWDILHGYLVPTAIPSYWPLFCFIIDILTGLYFLLRFRKMQQQQPTTPTPVNN